MWEIRRDGVKRGLRLAAQARGAAFLGALWLGGVVGWVLCAGPAYSLTIDKPLTAVEAAQLALERSYIVLSSEEEVKAADGQMKSTRSPVIPSLSAAARYRNTVDPTASRIAASAFPIFESQFWSASAVLNQQLVNFSTWGNIRAASRSEKAARDRYAATRADIALEAYRQFYELLKATKLAQVSRENLELSRDQLRRTEARFELGSVAKGDVLKQKVQLSQAELDILRDRRAILLESARLANLLGVDPSRPIPIDTTLTEPALEADSVAVLEEALARRPELAEARSLLAGAEAGLGSAQGLRYPSIDGSLGYFFETPGWPDNLNQIGNFDNWSLQLTMSVPIFDGFNAKGQIRQAEARKLQANYQLRDQELKISVEVEEVLQAISLSRERIDVARDGLAAAAEDLKLSQEKYNVGSATVLELIDAQVNHVRAQSDYVSALADAHVAVVQLRRVRGEPF
jgi:outer membrane protein TolC